MRLSDTFESVPMPEKGCSCNKQGYVYHFGKGYRNSKGQPTCKQTMIGKLHQESGMLIPNKNYFEIYGAKPKMKSAKISAIKTFGDYCFFNFIAQDLKIDKILNKIFGDAIEDLLIIAIYLVLYRNQLSDCEKWCEETLNIFSKTLPAQHCSSILSKIDETKKMDFFNAWIHTLKEKEQGLVYSIMTPSPYNREFDDIESAYNQDRIHLPQNHLGMLYGEKSRLPVYYNMYDDSTDDENRLAAIMTDSLQLGFQKLLFVEGRNSLTNESMQVMVRSSYPYICSINTSQPIPQKLIYANCDNINHHHNTINSAGISGIPIENDDYGFQCNIHLFYDTTAAVDANRLLKERIDQWDKNIIDGKNFPKKAARFFISKKDALNNVVYKKDHAYITHFAKQLGFFLIMTTDFSRTSADVLQISKEKDIIEKSFQDIQYSLDLSRFGAYSIATCNGFVFAVFLGLILKSFASQKLKYYLEYNRSSSIETVFWELRKIKVIKTIDGWALKTPITKKQRMFFEMIQKNEAAITTQLEKMSQHKLLQESL